MTLVADEGHGPETRRGRLDGSGSGRGHDRRRGRGPILLIDVERESSGRGRCGRVDPGGADVARDGRDRQEVALVSGGVVESSESVTATVLDGDDETEGEAPTGGTASGRGRIVRVSTGVEVTIGVGQVLVEREELESGDGSDDRLTGGVVELELLDHVKRSIVGEGHGRRVTRGSHREVEDKTLEEGVRLKLDLCRRSGGECYLLVGHRCEGRSAGKRDRRGGGRLRTHRRTAEVGGSGSGARGADSGRSRDHGHIYVSP